MSFGLSSDKSAYHSPYYVSIFHEDTPINWVLASCALKSQSHLLANTEVASDIGTVFEHHSPVCVIASQRFSVEHFIALKNRGYEQIYLVSKPELVEYNMKYYSVLFPINAAVSDEQTKESNSKHTDDLLGAFKCVSYEEILDYVKLMGNAYPLYDDYLAIMGDSPDKAKISMRLKFIERGLTADGTNIKEALTGLCSRINYHSLLDIVLAKGRAYFDISESMANNAIREARIVSYVVGVNNAPNKKCALIHASPLSIDALMNLAPMSETFTECGVLVYAMYDFPNAHWKLEAYTKGESAYDYLNELFACEGTVKGTYSHATGETTTL
jgi:hypothetical protein